MKRLTKTYSDGTHGASDSLPCGENSYDYKNLLIEKLGKYEDLEEQDRLVILSCKVGDTVWDNDCGRPCAYTITAFSFGECEEYICEPVTTKEVVFYYTNSSGSITGSFAESEIGKSVFLNKSEAEAKLKELRGGENEPCCRCDSKVSENDDTKNKVTSLEIIVRMIDNKPYYEIKYKKVNEDYYQVGYSSFNIDNVLKWCDECFELVYVKTTHGDRIRNMSDEELAELITGSLNFDCADYCDNFTQGCAFNCNKKDREIALKWLQSEVE